MDPQQLSREELLVLMEKMTEEWRCERRLLWDTIAGLQEKSRKDSLTGAANRAVLRAHLKMFYRVATSDSGMFWGLLALLDLNEFKSFNDVHGHLEGDKLLQFFVEELRVHFPKCIVYRLSGDEFVITYLGDTETEVAEMATFIKRDLENGIPYNDQYVIRVSVGIVWSCLNGTFDAERLIQTADERMYKEKPFARKGPGRKNDLVLS